MTICETCGQSYHHRLKQCPFCGGSQDRSSKAQPGQLGVVIKGVNGQIALSDTYLTIARKGILGFMTQGLKGEKRIPYSSISAIQFKRAGLVNGYIQFSILGGVEARGGAFDATQDENTVMFKSSQARAFEQLRDQVQDLMTASRTPTAAPSASSNVADQLTKLAELLDRGLLTAEEFQAEKSKLLRTA